MAISSTAYTSLAVQVVKKINDNILDTEEVIDTLLRLLGLTSKDQGTQGFVFFLKRKDKASIEAKTQFVKYLKALKTRLDKWSKDANTVRINKIQRLLGENSDTALQADITLDDSLDVALQKLQKFKTQLALEQDQNGLLNTEYAFYQAATDKMDSVASALPISDLGLFGPELVSIMRADSSVLSNTLKRFQRQKIGLETELARLQNDESYLQTGAALEKSVKGQKVSLTNVISVCTYFAEKINYQCKECIYFGSSSSLCLYGGNKLETKPGNSCLEVYKKSDNQFWRASAETVTKVKAEAMPGGATTTSTQTPAPAATPAPAPTTSTPATTGSTSSTPPSSGSATATTAAPASGTAATTPATTTPTTTTASTGQTVVPTAAAPTQKKAVIPSQQIDQQKVYQRRAEILREWNAEPGRITKEGGPARALSRAEQQATSEQIQELKKQNPDWGT